MYFDFVYTKPTNESLSQRISWEKRVPNGHFYKTTPFTVCGVYLAFYDQIQFTFTVNECSGVGFVITVTTIFNCPTNLFTCFKPVICYAIPKSKLYWDDITTVKPYIFSGNGQFLVFSLVRVLNYYCQFYKTWGTQSIQILILKIEHLKKEAKGTLFSFWLVELTL